MHVALFKSPAVAHRYAGGEVSDVVGVTSSRTRFCPNQVNAGVHTDPPVGGAIHAGCLVDQEVGLLLAS